MSEITTKGLAYPNFGWLAKRACNLYSLSLASVSLFHFKLKVAIKKFSHLRSLCPHLSWNWKILKTSFLTSHQHVFSELERQSSQLAQFFTYKMELQDKQYHFKAPQVESHDVWESVTSDSFYNSTNYNIYTIQIHIS